ncbi:unnamed protein product [Caenorhabditis auriculariae]|uniref:Ubiquitin carboxyl-terminal hydrolase n=1 Tax=Caenorhabditis auriculariae TaxID=2777116 RepID=A0A8S1HKH4_9PELO|nr:unnamed protein product [Caenorhabditis auriculariae]
MYLLKGSIKVAKMSESGRDPQQGDDKQKQEEKYEGEMETTKGDEAIFEAHEEPAVETSEKARQEAGDPSSDVTPGNAFATDVVHADSSPVYTEDVQRVQVGSSNKHEGDNSKADKETREDRLGAGNETKSEEVERLCAQKGPYVPSVEELQTTAGNTYKAKCIRFGPITYRIVMQNKNGPCPLIAIVNSLVLRGDVTIPDHPVVVNEELVQLVAERLLRPAESQNQQDFERNLEDVIRLLPSLNQGLDVNVGFSNVTDFEFTSALALFDLLNITLYHAWVADPQMKIIYDLVKPLKYNQLVMEICNEKNEDRELLREFLEAYQSQLTFNGLTELIDRMKDGEIAVFFRNNHFYTCLKRRDELFTLVTDEGFAEEPNIVWESLSSVDGDSFFVNPDFHTYVPPVASASETPSDAQTDSRGTSPNSVEVLSKDFLLALQLQNEEEEQASNLPEPTNRGGSTPSPSPPNPPMPRSKSQSKCIVM